MTNGSVRVSVFGKTDLGRTRDHNEDTFLVADLSTGNASLQPEVRNHQIGPRGSLFMVADGMGGAAAGELASAMAADVIHRHMATRLGPRRQPRSFPVCFSNEGGGRARQRRDLLATPGSTPRCEGWARL